jgi:hypothetical protein
MKTPEDCFAWVADHEESLWLESIPEKPTTLVNRLNNNYLIEGRYLNIYKKTKEFAATPIINSGKFLGCIVSKWKFHSNWRGWISDG